MTKLEALFAEAQDKVARPGEAFIDLFELFIPILLQWLESCGAAETAKRAKAGSFADRLRMRIQLWRNDVHWSNRRRVVDAMFDTSGAHEVAELQEALEELQAAA